MNAATRLYRHLGQLPGGPEPEGHLSGGTGGHGLLLLEAPEPTGHGHTVVRARSTGSDILMRHRCCSPHHMSLLECSLSRLYVSRLTPAPVPPIPPAALVPQGTSVAFTEAVRRVFSARSCSLVAIAQRSPGPVHQHGVPARSLHHRCPSHDCAADCWECH